jgi:hypothetical protein
MCMSVIPVGAVASVLMGGRTSLGLVGLALCTRMVQHVAAGMACVARWQCPPTEDGGNRFLMNSLTGAQRSYRWKRQAHSAQTGRNKQLAGQQEAGTACAEVDCEQSLWRGVTSSELDCCGSSGQQEAGPVV